MGSLCCSGDCNEKRHAYYEELNKRPAVENLEEIGELTILIAIGMPGTGLHY